MKEFADIGKKLPYGESPLYVEQLTGRCVENAAATRAPGRFRPWAYGFAALAAAAIAVGVFFQLRPVSPIDSYLASLSDEDAAIIVDYTVDTIYEIY